MQIVQNYCSKKEDSTRIRDLRSGELHSDNHYVKHFVARYDFSDSYMG